MSLSDGREQVRAAELAPKDPAPLSAFLRLAPSALVVALLLRVARRGS